MLILLLFDVDFIVIFHVYSVVMFHVDFIVMFHVYSVVMFVVAPCIC